MRLLYISIFIILSMLASTTYAADQQLQYTVLLTVINNTGTKGGFGVCKNAISPETETLCSIPGKLNKGTNRIFTPPYKNPVPVFTTIPEEKAYTCGTAANPEQQLSFSTTNKKSTTITISSFIKDKDNKNVAVSCAITQK
jgi:hypothetical protein